MDELPYGIIPGLLWSIDGNPVECTVGLSNAKSDKHLNEVRDERDGVER